MHLPRSIQNCMQALQSASYPTFAVGGCVRDWLLGQQPKDHDLCTAATPEQIQQVFSGYRLLLHGVKHGTVGVVLDDTVVEITTFRAEGTYSDNRHPDWVKFVTDIESDLARRDFTVNAMAWSPETGLCDPFGGQQDLHRRILRAVGDPDTRFREDALRILRGIRFAARLGMDVEDNTYSAMLRQLPLTDSLARERVFSELSLLLLDANARDILRFAPILTHIIPALSPMVGFEQHSPHHAYDVYTHTAYVVENAPRSPALRWAALLHDVGKVHTFTRDENGRGHFYGHAGESAIIADQILRQLKAPTALREDVVQLIEQHMADIFADEKFLRRRISKLGDANLLVQLLQLQEADQNSKGVAENEPIDFAAIYDALQRVLAQSQCLQLQDLAIGGNDLIAAGFTPGPKFSACLQYLLVQVLSDTLPNEHGALLAAAHAYFTQTPEEPK